MAPPTATETAIETAAAQHPPSESSAAGKTAQMGGKKVQAGAKQMKFNGPPTFKSKEEEREHRKRKLCAAFRILGHHGLNEGVAGHLTVRDPIQTDCFWVNPFGRAFSMMRVKDLVLVNSKGEIIDGGVPENQIYNQAAFAIHHAIHMARPDVNAAAHSHTIYGRAFSTFGRNIDMTHQDACTFYNDLAVYEGFGGVVLAEEEGNNISEALGKKKAIILQNHGILTTAQSIEAATFWFIALESLCRIQLLTDAASAGSGHKTIPVGDEEAAFTYKTTGSEMAGWFQAQPYFNFIEEKYGKEMYDD